MCWKSMAMRKDASSDALPTVTSTLVIIASLSCSLSLRVELLLKSHFNFFIFSVIVQTPY